MDDCVFCKIVKGEIEARVVHRDDRCVAFEDLNPQAPTHVLVVPREHVATLDDLADDQAELAGHLILVARDIARERGHADAGYRTVFNCKSAGGQSVFHIHLHLLAGRTLGWPPG